MSRLRSTVGKVNRSLDKLDMPPSVSVCGFSYASSRKALIKGCHQFTSFIVARPIRH